MLVRLPASDEFFVRLAIGKFCRSLGKIYRPLTECSPTYQ
jgi:hypothetical protein